MTVRKEYEFDIRSDCWGGAKNRVNSLTDELIDKLENVLDDPELWSEEIPTDTEVNDFIWFEDDTYADWLGFKDADQLWKYCDMIDNGADEDEIWVDDENELLDSDELESRFRNAIANEEIYEDDYADAEEWAEDIGYERFEL